MRQLFALYLLALSSIGLSAAKIQRIDALPSTMTAYSMPDERGEARIARPRDSIILQISLQDLDLREVDELRQIFYELSRYPLNRFQICGILLLLDNRFFGSFEAAGSLLNELRAFAEARQVMIYAYSNYGIFGFGNIVSCAAERIYTSTQALCGEIGIIDIFKNTRERLQIEQTFDTDLVAQVTDPDITLLRTGKQRATGDRWALWGPDEFSAIQELAATEYELFLELLKEARSDLNMAEVMSIGSGPLVAPDAAALGLIDEIGVSREHALHDLVVAAGCAKRYRVIELFENPAGHP